MSDTASFAVVTVNYGSSALVAENFGRLDLGPRGRLIIVDSFSSTEERDAVRVVAETLGEQVFNFVLLNKRQEWKRYRDQVTPFELDTNLGAL